MFVYSWWSHDILFCFEITKFVLARLQLMWLWFKISIIFWEKVRKLMIFYNIHIFVLFLSFFLSCSCNYITYNNSVFWQGVTVVKPVIYGNIARYFGKKREEDGHTHQWTVYVKPFKNEVSVSIITWHWWKRNHMTVLPIEDRINWNFIQLDLLHIYLLHGSGSDIRIDSNHTTQS